MQRFRIWTPPILWALLIFTVSSIPSLQVTQDTLLQHILNTTGHFVEYAIFAMLIYKALRKDMPGTNIRARTFLITTLYAISDEFHQFFVPGRQADIIDIAVDTLGIIGAIWWLTSRTSNKQKS